MENAEAKPDERHSGAQKVVFLCFTEPVGVSADGIRPHLSEHKAWLAERERSADLLFAGPMLDEDYRYSGSGLLDIQAESIAAANDIADRDPLHINGIRQYRMVPWQINEGSVDIRLTLSDGKFTLK